jgi:extradiol dioxygenase family protein
VDNLQEVYDRLVKEGVEFVTPPVQWPAEEGGWRVLFLYDPDGNLLELTEEGIGVNIESAS